MRKYKDNIIALLLSIIGFAYVVYYIFRASTNVVTSDYMRIVNSYLYDVSDLKYLKSMESISRIPFTFLARFINVKLFSYNVFFDKILGACGLLIFNFVTVKYILKTIDTSLVKIIASIVVTFISFSLMSWEMILNGTGYAHFLTMGLIAITYYLFDVFINYTCKKTCMGDQHRKGELCEPETVGASTASPRKNFGIALIILTIITSLCFAGSYAVSYDCTLILFSLLAIVIIVKSLELFSRDKIELTISNEVDEVNIDLSVKKKLNDSSKKSLCIYIIIIIVSVICISLYMISNNTGEPLIPVGFQDITLLELLKTNPLFPVKFLLKSLASSIIGVETFDYAINFGTITEKVIYLFGIIYLLIILWTIFVVIVGAKHRDPEIVGASTASPKAVGAKHRDPEIVGASYASPTVFPFMYVIYGFMNYALVFLARYKFVRDEYGMTSRYALQYMFLSIGIVILLSMFMDKVFVDKKFTTKNIIICLVSVACIFVLYFGNVVTSCDEIYKADYRKIIYTNLVDIAKNSENYTDEELENFFEYHRDSEHIRNTFKILKEQQLNVFEAK